MSTASGEEEDGDDRQRRQFKMKPTLGSPLTTSSFWYEERGHDKAGTRAGGARRGGDDGGGVSTASGQEEDGSENAEMRRNNQ